ncbi:Cytochrome c oxidase subunit [Rhynchospora pubera]|uniref:Cytochrome c oxidase subunit n=1 Tax=Rhynchospora pubera TaxID=906938 RepID=A0AAV8DDR9_9POAL|nr:Cytochrome c oxidase subunit [Rhynchospora pubera]KAJ4817486.1 Cytochrome c oxidase subunit [Rhynchospora pubera]
MAEESKIPSLAEQYTLLKSEDNVENTSVPEVKVTEEEKPVELTSKVVEAAGAAPEEGAEVATDKVAIVPPENTEEEETNTAPEVEDSATTETEAAAVEGEAEEEKPEVKIETAPADFRFPTTNQTRHCFTRYVEYHRCVAAKGEDASECDKFAKYYRSLCPSEWVERWNEQRENGTFPGPL